MVGGMGPLVRFAYRLRAWVYRTLQLRSRGVKVMLFNAAGEVLLVRHTYVNPDLFLLPGGGVGRRETPEASAAREVREELGIGVRNLALMSEHFSGAEGKRDSLHLFRAIADGVPKPDGVEVREARFFPLDALPGNVSPATLRRIAEYRGQRQADGSW